MGRFYLKTASTYRGPHAYQTYLSHLPIALTYRTYLSDLPIALISQEVFSQLFASYACQLFYNFIHLYILIFTAPEIGTKTSVKSVMSDRSR